MGKWIPIVLAGGLEIAARVHARFGAAVAVTFFYLIANGTWVSLYVNRYSTVNPYDLQAIKYFALDSLWKLLLVAGILLCLRQDRVSYEGLKGWGRFACGLFFVVSTVAIGWEWAFDPAHCDGINYCGGSLLNPSLNSAMMAVTLPLLPFPLVGAAIVAVCAFLGKTSIGAGMVAIYLMGRVVSAKRAAKWAIPAAALVLFLGYYTHGYKAFFDSSGRFQMWWFFMRVWAANPRNWLFGTGFGTFGVFSVNLQHAFNMNPSDWWIWIHNDWPLQSTFETGIAGTGLMGWLYAAIALGLWRRHLHAEMFSWLLFGIVLGCEYTLHIGPCCAYAAWMLAIALLKVDANRPSTSYYFQGEST